MRKVQFQTVGSVSDEKLELNTAYSKSLNLPAPKATAKKLAVVGGGDSARSDQLQQFDGEVWGVNGAARFCNERGIPATLYSISPLPAHDRDLQGITRAVLSYECDPSTFDRLAGTELYAFDRDEYGPTSACAIPALAYAAGFKEVHFFGCEGNYSQHSTHIYENTPNNSDMIVRVCGADYRTNVGYFLQSQLLAHVIREAPDYCKDRSCGLLGALIADPEGWDVLTLPCEMKAAE